MCNAAEVLRESEEGTACISSGEFWDGFAQHMACDLNLEQDLNEFGDIIHFKPRKRYFRLRRQEVCMKILLLLIIASLVLNQAPE